MSRIFSAWRKCCSPAAATACEPRYHAKLLRIDHDLASALFRQHNLWEEVTSLLAYHTSYMVYRDDLVLQQRTYSVIRNHLLEMMLLSEETRQRVSILEYIQDRTLLSRSSILNVLSALKKGGYIAFARGGYLQNIVSLPEKF